MIKPFNTTNVKTLKKYLKGNYYISQLPFEDKRIQIWSLLNPPTGSMSNMFPPLCPGQFSSACRLCYWARELATYILLQKYFLREMQEGNPICYHFLTPPS